MYDKDLVIKLKQLGQTWDEIGEVYDESGEKMRCWAKRQDWFPEIREDHKITNAVKNEVDTKTVAEDGKITSTIKKRLNEKKTFSEDELLDLHGLNADEFKIKTITSNEWSMTNSDGEQYYNFQSKIIAESTKDEKTVLDRIQSLITDYNQPCNIECSTRETLDSYLVIPLFDLHFGLNKASDYAEYQERLLQLLENGYQKVLIVLGGDLFNTNDFHNQTIHQTRVSDTNIPEAWEETTLFLCPIIEKALNNSPEIEIMYNRGNHSETVDWTYAQFLKVKYPQVQFDDEVKQLKAVLLGEVAIFATHGHIRKQPKDLIALCSALYPDIWGKSKRRFLFTGHNHFDKEEDFPGITYSQFTSPSKSTDFEEENMYLGTQNGMRVFEVSDEQLLAKYYL